MNHFWLLIYFFITNFHCICIFEEQRFLSPLAKLYREGAKNSIYYKLYNHDHCDAVYVDTIKMILNSFFFILSLSMSAAVIRNQVI